MTHLIYHKWKQHNTYAPYGSQFATVGDGTFLGDFKRVWYMTWAVTDHIHTAGVYNPEQHMDNLGGRKPRYFKKFFLLLSWREANIKTGVRVGERSMCIKDWFKSIVPLFLTWLLDLTSNIHVDFATPLLLKKLHLWSHGCFLLWFWYRPTCVSRHGCVQAEACMSLHDKMHKCKVSSTFDAQGAWVSTVFYLRFHIPWSWSQKLEYHPKWNWWVWTLLNWWPPHTNVAYLCSDQVWNSS